MSIVLGLAISNKKLFPEDGIYKKMGFLTEFRLFCGTENDLNSIPLNRNGSKLFNFCSNAFRKRKTSSESPKIEENFQNFVSKTFRGRKQALNSFDSAEFFQNIVPVPTLIVTYLHQICGGLFFCLFLFAYLYLVIG
jgi:hypothetical protein